MDEKTYIKERVSDQLAWFEKKSTWNQKRYKRTKILVLTLSVSIPLLAGFIDDERDWIKLVIGLEGLAIAVAEGLLAIYKYQENWIQYRATAEALKREEYLYHTRSGMYRDSDAPFNDFVVQIEGILDQDRDSWRDYIKK